MSDFQAIGGVSATLQALLYDRMERPDGVTDIQVTVGSPKANGRDAEPTAENARVNLFLYRVTENGFLQNQEIPRHGSPDAYGHPPLSLNLHYLITAYGTEPVTKFGNATGTVYDDKLAHFVLGSAMRVLHDYTIITERLRTVTPPSGEPILHPSLQDEFERAKLMLEPLSLEDVTKVWTALTLRYRLSAAYAVHVVQIESRRPRRFPRPVGEPPSPYPPAGGPAVPGPFVQVVTLQTPSISDIRVRRLGEAVDRPFPYARIGDTLVILGTSLGKTSRVVIGALEVPPGAVSGARVEAAIPDDTLPSGAAIAPADRLQPGPQPVAVIASEPALPQSGVKSNQSVILLVPRVGLLPPSVLPALEATRPPARLTIRGVRLTHPSAGGETVVGPSVIPKNAYVSAAPDQLVIPLPDTLPAAEVRLFVSGALPDPVLLGPAAQQLDLTIDGVTVPVDLELPLSEARSAIPALLQRAIRDAAPDKPAFATVRVGLFGDRLVLLAGGLSGAITAAPRGPSTIVADLQLAAPQPAGAAHGVQSGALVPFPTLAATQPALLVQIGGAPRPVVFDRPTSLDDAAVKLQVAIRAASGAPAYRDAQVTSLADQLLLLPGDAAAVAFAPSPSDGRSVAELQLQARYAVRVRANGAESIDDAPLLLPPP